MIVSRPLTASYTPYPCTPHRAALYASHLATYMVYTSICNYNNIFIRTFKTMAVQNTGKTLSTFS